MNLGAGQLKNILRYIRYIYILSRTDFFDENYYRTQTKKKFGIRSLYVMHYCIFGERKLYKPNNWFDPNVYLEINQDVKTSISPTYHYVTSGVREGRLHDGIRKSASDAIPYKNKKPIPTITQRLTRKKIESLNLLDPQEINRVEDNNENYKYQPKSSLRPDLLLKDRQNIKKESSSQYITKKLSDICTNRELHITEYSFGEMLLSSRQKNILKKKIPAIKSIKRSSDIVIQENIYSEREKIYISLDSFMNSSGSEELIVNEKQAIYKINPNQLTFDTLASVRKKSAKKINDINRLLELISKKITITPEWEFNWRGQRINIILPNKNIDATLKEELVMFLYLITNHPLNDFLSIKCARWPHVIKIYAANSNASNLMPKEKYDVDEVKYAIQITRYK